MSLRYDIRIEMSSQTLWILAALAAFAYLALILLSVRVLKATVLLGLVLLTLALAFTVDWDSPVTPAVLLKFLGLFTCGYWVAALIRKEWRLWNGLEQWPLPKGRYYDRWMSLPIEAGNYYEWLAAQKGGKEPWASWATLEREMEMKKAPKG